MVKLVILIHLIALMLDQCHRFQMLQEGVTFGAIGLNFSILKLKVFIFYSVSIFNAASEMDRA